MLLPCHSDDEPVLIVRQGEVIQTQLRQKSAFTLSSVRSSQQSGTIVFKRKEQKMNTKITLVFLYRV